GRPSKPGDDTGGEHRRGSLDRPARRGAYGQRDQREETEACDRGQECPEREEKPAVRLTPHASQEPERDRDVEDGRTEGDVAERQDRHRQRERETEADIDDRAGRGERSEAERPAGREERDRPGSP